MRLLRVRRRTADRRRRPVPWRALARAAVAAAILALPVAALAVLVRVGYEPLLAVDESAIRQGTGLARAHPVLHQVLLVWQTAFRAAWVNLVAIGLCVWVWRRTGGRSRSLWAATTILVSWALALGTKYVVQRARPVVDDAVALAPGYSFPSGHVANTASAVGALTLLVWPLLTAAGRVLVCTIGAALVLATAADRVLLGVHYPSDALAGVAFGAAVVAGSYLGYTGWSPTGPPSHPEPPG